MQRNRRLPTWMAKKQEQLPKGNDERSYNEYELNDAESSETRVAKINARLKAANCLTYDKKIYYLTDFYEISQASQELIDWLNNITEEGKIPVAFDMEFISLLYY